MLYDLLELVGVVNSIHWAVHLPDGVNILEYLRVVVPALLNVVNWSCQLLESVHMLVDDVEVVFGVGELVYRAMHVLHTGDLHRHLAVVVLPVHLVDRTWKERKDLSYYMFY